MRKSVVLIVALVLTIIGVGIVIGTSLVLSSSIPLDINENTVPKIPTVDDEIRITLESPGESIDGIWLPTATVLDIWDPEHRIEIEPTYSRFEGHRPWDESFNATLGTDSPRTVEEIVPIVVLKLPDSLKPDSYPFEIKLNLSYPRSDGSSCVVEKAAIHVIDTLRIVSREDRVLVSSRLSPFKSAGIIIGGFGATLFLLLIMSSIRSRYRH
jgi:hypothetical protein